MSREKTDWYFRLEFGVASDKVEVGQRLALGSLVVEQINGEREMAAGIIKRKLKEGVIVNISSISSAGNAGQSNYAASKAGLDACTRTWALELAP